jgi:hypothetical protein
MNAPYDPFKGFGKAQPGMGGNKVKPGQHLFKVLSLKLKMSTNPKTNGQPVVIAELETEMSNIHAKGERPSRTMNLTKGPAMFELKQFLFSALHFNQNFQGANAITMAALDADEDGAIAKYATGPENPCAGVYVTCSAVATKTQANFDFVNCQWSPGAPAQ